MEYDVVIIGSGPAGYVAGIRAGQLGLKTAIVEKNAMGGMCLNWGCIPTKAFLESAKRLEMVREAKSFGVEGIDESSLSFSWTTAQQRAKRIVKRLSKGVEYLLKKNGVDIISGQAVINSTHSVSVENRLLETEHILIATGTRPKPLSGSLPEKVALEVEGIMTLEKIPGRVVVVGNQPYAVELAQFFHMIGKVVTLLDPDGVILRGADPFLSDFITRMFKKRRIEILQFSDIKGFEKGKLILDEKRVECDLVVNADERQAILPEHSLDLDMKDGFPVVDEALRTGIKNIYAIGDVNGLSSFAHAASAQGLHAVNTIKGIQSVIDLKTIPINMYTYPEMAQIGYTAPQLEQRGIEYKASEFPLSANGKALTEGQSEGKIRMLSDVKYGEVLGVQIIADHATDMIAEAASFMRLEGTVYDVAGTIHAHPTVSEVFMEAGFAAFDQPIHK